MTADECAGCGDDPCPLCHGCTCPDLLCRCEGLYINTDWNTPW